jgi:GT2 family glycosyltransferase
MAPRVAAVIVNYNAGEHLERTLGCLARQTLHPARTILVDNASTDRSLDGIAECHPEVELVRLERNVGFAAANNLAVRLADDCELVALVNPDAFAEPDWLATLVSAAEEHPEYSFFGSRLVLSLTPELLDGTGDVYHVSGVAWRRDQYWPAELARGRGETFSACAAAAVYRRDAFLEVGGFDESFFCYYEDSDLAFRLRLAGHRCLHVDDAVVHHYGSATSGVRSDFSLYHSLRNQVWTYVKNMPGPLLLLYSPLYLLNALLALIALTFEGRARLMLRAKRDALRELPRVLRERRRIQRARRAGAAELRAVLATGPVGFIEAFGMQEGRIGRLVKRGRPGGGVRASVLRAESGPRRFRSRRARG